jgi:hypothetical protein
VLNAGASPLLRPVHHHTWQTFSRNWEVDVQHVFHWTREALLLPLDPGTNVITLSSGAAISGSPLTGGYAGAKATIRFLTAYAQAESDRQGLGIRFTSVLPKLTAGTDLGAAAVTAYANRQGVDPAAFLDGLGPTLSPEQVGKTILDLIVDPSYDQEAYLLTPTGLAQSAEVDARRGLSSTPLCAGIVPASGHRCGIGYMSRGRGPYFCRYCRGPNPVARVNARRNAVGSP